MGQKIGSKEEASSLGERFSRFKDVGSIVLHYVITADVLTKMHFSLKRCTDYLQVI